MLEAKRSGLSAGAQLPAVTKAVLMPLCIQGLLPRVKKKKKKSHGDLLFSAPAPFHTFQHFQIPQSAAAFDAVWKRGGRAFIVS